MLGVVIEHPSPCGAPTVGGLCRRRAPDGPWTASKRNRSAHVHRTTSKPSARIASSRSFSRWTVSAVAPGSSVPYLLRPSNSPTTPSSSQRKSGRATNAPEGVRSSYCSFGAGNPADRIRSRLSDSPGLSLRPSRKATVRRAAAIPCRMPDDASASGSRGAIWGCARSAASPAMTAESTDSVRARSTTVRATVVVRRPATTQTSSG